MFSDQIWTSWTDAAALVLSAVSMVVATIVMIRVVGLQSLSKMSSFDFAVTVAIGSIMASAVVSSTRVANGVLGIVALLIVRTVVALLRQRTSTTTTPARRLPIVATMRDDRLSQGA